MGVKNYGPSVSGFLDPDGRNFETAVFQAGKPVLDKDLNLSEDLAASQYHGLARKIAPSGWLTSDGLNKADPTATIFSSSATANLLVLANNLQALVNGWHLRVANTGSNAANQVTLGAGPSGAGAKRTDVVILEVWRRLISCSPSTVGKSPAGRIWRNGNVKVASGDDNTLNYADDILDGTINTETTKRVQIQYRLRVVQGVDLFAYPSAVDDPVVVAHTVPATAGAPDGTSTAFVYTNQSANEDPSLWRAGDGNPANGLGTVDGYMYAIPLVGVFRRNTTAFARSNNHNGGVATPGPSDRPDGLFHDIISLIDLADLRQSTSLTGWSYPELGEKAFNALLDNATKTEWETTPLGGGVSGHTVLWADEVGVLPGDGVTTGDTPGAEFLGQFDCTRRFISDRPVYEVMTFKIAPGSPDVSTATWQAGTVVTLNPAAIAQHPYSGAIGFISRAPTGTRIVDVVGARVAGETGGDENVDVGLIQAVAPATTSTVFPVTRVAGLGSYPPSNVVITLGTPPAGLSTEPLYVDLLIGYPPGSGLSKTPTADYGNASFVVNNPGALSAAAPVSYSAMETRTFDATHREIAVQYRTSVITTQFSAYSTINPGTKYILPERAFSLSQVRINGTPLGGVGGTLDASGRILTLVGGSTVPNDLVAVDYVALRPMPQSGVQMTIYYQARAAQTVRSGLLGTSQTLVPRWISPFLFSLTTGSGSNGEGYPFPQGYVQTGGVLKTGGVWAGEHELDGSPEIYVAEFNATTGFVRVPAFVPYSPNPDAVTFTRATNDTDIENRTFFPTTPGGYKPNAFGQNLSDERVHKVLMPTIMEAPADSTLGRKGALYLVLFTRWAQFDAENSVKFLASNNTSVASVFRLAGNPINRRV